MRPQEWPPLNLRKRGRCSQLPQLCERAYMCERACMEPCAKCWYLWEVVLVHASPFSGVFPVPIMISIWTRSLSLVVGCKILFWKLTKYQHPLTPVCQGCCLTFPKKPKIKKNPTRMLPNDTLFLSKLNYKKCKWTIVKEKSNRWLIISLKTVNNSQY